MQLLSGSEKFGIAMTTLALTLSLAACGGSSDGGTAPTPTIQIVASPTSLSVVQGQSGTVQLTLTRAGGFAGDVNVSASGMPAGVTATVTPAALNASTTAATVTVSAAANTVPGTYSVTVAASGTAVTQVSAPFQLTITAAPSFSLAATPTALAANAGSSVNTSVAITRTNLPGAVTLSLDNAPAGITGTFTPAVTTTDVSQLTVATSTAVVPGVYTLTVKGTAAGATDRTAALTLTVGAAPNFTLAAAPTPVAIVAGASGSSTITIARTNFTGEVALSLVAPPSGVTATFAPNATTANTSVATLNIAGSVASGSYTLTVQGAATGPGNKTTTIQITVTAPADFAITTAPAAISIIAGATGVSTVTLTRTNFGGAITLALAGPPAGITATFAPNVTLTNSSVATISVASSVAAGTYDLVLQGSGLSVGARTTPLHVTVVAAPTATLVDFAVCSDVLSQFVWAAYRDGNGPWTRITPTTNNGVTRMQFPITAPTAAVAYTISQPANNIRSALTSPMQVAVQRPNLRTTRDGVYLARFSSPVGDAPASYVTTQLHFLKSEVAQFANCTSVTASSSVNATVSGLSPGDIAHVASVGGTSTNFTSATSAQTLNAPTGAQDFWTVNQGASGTSISSEVKRGVTVPGALTVNAAAMSPALVATVTLTGVPDGGTVFDNMELTTAGGTIGPIILSGTQPNTIRRIIANSSSLASDMYGYHFDVDGLDGNYIQIYSGTYYFGTTVTNKTIAVHPPAPAWTTSVIASTPYPRLRTTGTIPSAYNSMVSVTQLGVGIQGNLYTVSATGGWLAAQGSATSYDLIMEDLVPAQWPTAAALVSPANTSMLMLTGSNYTLHPVAGSFKIFVIRSFAS